MSCLSFRLCLRRTAGNGPRQLNAQCTVDLGYHLWVVHGSALLGLLDDLRLLVDLIGQIFLAPAFRGAGLHHSFPHIRPARFMPEILCFLLEFPCTGTTCRAHGAMATQARIATATSFLDSLRIASACGLLQVRFSSR